MWNPSMVMLAIMAGPWLAWHADARAEGAPPAPSHDTAQDRRAAASLNGVGDRAYRAGRFDQALKAYMSAYPNAPNAHAYLMSGDTHWRAVLAASRAAPSGEPPHCSLSNAHFPNDVRRSLEQHFHRGLALRPGARLRQRATATAACLDDLATQYERLPASSCVELSQLSACLGAPLLK